VTEVPVGSAADELALARETLQAARVLAREGLHRHAVGRSYYAVFHGACALLASVGLHARTHDGVRALVNEHFVRPGRLGAEHARTLRQTASDRSDADYDSSATFDADDSGQDIARADAFLSAVAAVLLAGGTPTP
jgi:uncharacterized protein (UPF0332 family)